MIEGLAAFNTSEPPLRKEPPRGDERDLGHRGVAQAKSETEAPVRAPGEAQGSSGQDHGRDDEARDRGLGRHIDLRA
jgi:hypothetical protein